MTMEKWDKMVVLLQEHGLKDFLKIIYTNMDKELDLHREMKNVLLNSVEQWQINNP